MPTPKELEKMKEEIERYKEEIARRKQEQLDDARYEGRQKSKLMRELRNPKKKRDYMTEKRPSKDYSAEQQKQIEEFLRKGPQPAKPKEAPISKRVPLEQPSKEELKKQQLRMLEDAEREAKKPKKPVSKEELKKQQLKMLEDAERENEKGKASPQERSIEDLEKDPTLVQQPPKGGYKCENHPDRPGVMRIKHYEALGKDKGDLAFCEDCAWRIKMLPVMENSPSKALLKRLSELATKLDIKGLYKEADFIDSFLIALS